MVPLSRGSPLTTATPCSQQGSMGPAVGHPAMHYSRASRLRRPKNCHIFYALSSQPCKSPNIRGYFATYVPENLSFPDLIRRERPVADSLCPRAEGTPASAHFPLLTPRTHWPHDVVTVISLLQVATGAARATNYARDYGWHFRGPQLSSHWKTRCGAAPAVAEQSHICLCF